MDQFPIRKLEAGSSHAQPHPFPSNFPCSLVFLDGLQASLRAVSTHRFFPFPLLECPGLWRSSCVFLLCYPLICMPVTGSASCFPSGFLALLFRSYTQSSGIWEQRSRWRQSHGKCNSWKLCLQRVASQTDNRQKEQQTDAFKHEKFCKV